MLWISRSFTHVNISECTVMRLRPTVSRRDEPAHVVSGLGTGVELDAEVDHRVIPVVEASRPRDSLRESEGRCRTHTAPTPCGADGVRPTGRLTPDPRALELVVRLIVSRESSPPCLVVVHPHRQRDAREAPTRRVVIPDLERPVSDSRRRTPCGID